jgi:hypothetical protein
MRTTTEIKMKLTLLNDLVENASKTSMAKRRAYASAIARHKGWFMEHGLRLTPVFANEQIVCYALQEDVCSI